jgi:hypothetical protein
MQRHRRDRYARPAALGDDGGLELRLVFATPNPAVQMIRLRSVDVST